MTTYDPEKICRRKAERGGDKIIRQCTEATTDLGFLGLGGGAILAANHWPVNLRSSYATTVWSHYLWYHTVVYLLGIRMKKCSRLSPAGAWKDAVQSMQHVRGGELGAGIAQCSMSSDLPDARSSTCTQYIQYILNLSVLPVAIIRMGQAFFIALPNGDTRQQYRITIFSPPALLIIRPHYRIKHVAIVF